MANSFKAKLKAWGKVNQLRVGSYGKRRRFTAGRPTFRTLTKRTGRVTFSFEKCSGTSERGVWCTAAKERDSDSKAKAKKIWPASD